MRIDRIKLITLMLEKDIKTQELAKKTGLARATISAARGGKSCSTETVLRLAKGLNVPLEELIEMR
ncbi:MAG: helix-turn-helix transcriptional regulator [Clostridiales bacterium]|nr:helix-turn-helix transcriptional regulator [Clostridiales bacterium]